MNSHGLDVTYQLWYRIVFPAVEQLTGQINNKSTTKAIRLAIMQYTVVFESKNWPLKNMFELNIDLLDSILTMAEQKAVRSHCDSHHMPGRQKLNVN